MPEATPEQAAIADEATREAFSRTDQYREIAEATGWHVQSKPQGMAADALKAEAVDFAQRKLSEEG